MGRRAASDAGAGRGVHALGEGALRERIGDILHGRPAAQDVDTKMLRLYVERLEVLSLLALLLQKYQLTGTRVQILTLRAARG